MTNLLEQAISCGCGDRADANGHWWAREAARERGNEACHRSVAVPVERAQVDRVDRSAGQTANHRNK